jgi:septal ring factor EnvC (AmiA/AmiB activator)
LTLYRVNRTFLKEMAQPINREHLKTILYDAEKLKSLDAQQSNINNAGIASASAASAASAAAAAAAAANASLKRKQSEMSDATGAENGAEGGADGDAPQQQQQVTRPAADADMMELDAMDAYEREAAGGPDDDELAAMMELEGH